MSRFLDIEQIAYCHGGLEAGPSTGAPMRPIEPVMAALAHGLEIVVVDVLGLLVEVGDGKHDPGASDGVKLAVHSLTSSIEVIKRRITSMFNATFAFAILKRLR